MIYDYQQTEPMEVTEGQHLNENVDENYSVQMQVQYDQHEQIYGESSAQKEQNEVEELANNEVVVVDKLEKENETRTLKYQEAKDIILEEKKQLIITKETEKTALGILMQRKADIQQQNGELRKLIDHSSTENQILAKKLTISKEEILNIQQRMTKNGEIVVKLKNFVTSIKTSYEDLSQRNANILSDTSNKKLKTDDWILKTLPKISKLQTDIKNANSSSRNNDIERYRNENLLLKQQISQKKEMLKTLSARHKELEQSEENVRIKEEEKEELVKLLVQKKQHLEELKTKMNQTDENKKIHLLTLENKAKEKRARLKELETAIDDLISKLIALNDRGIKNETMLVAKEAQKKQSEEDLVKIEKNIKHFEAELENIHQKNSQNIIPFKETLETLEKEIMIADDEKSRLKCRLDCLTSEHAQHNEERTELFLVKCGLDKKLEINQVLMTTFKMSTERNDKTKQKQQDLSEKIDKVSEDRTKLQDLIKDKAYLLSSQEYLNEKYANTKQQANTLKDSVRKIEEEFKEQLSLIQLKREELDTLRKQLEDKEKTGQFQQNELLAGILKPTPNTKTPPVSPKKVHFDVSSTESGKSSVEASQLSENADDGQSSVMDKMFDNLLHSFYKNKQAPKIGKKRQLDLE